MSATDKKIEALKPFVQYSAQFTKFKPVIAFYLKTYAVEKLHLLYKEQKQAGQDVEILESSLKQWFGECDALKAQHQQLQNKVACQQEMTEFALKLFLKSDNEEREDTFNMETVKNFKIVSALFEALNIFGPVSADIEKKGKYAKVKAVQVYKRLKDPNYVRKAPNMDQEFADFEKKMQMQEQQKQQNEGDVGDEGGIMPQKQQVYQSNFHNNNNNNSINQNNINQNQQNVNNNNNMNQFNQNVGGQSVFNQVPAVINKTTIKDQNQVSKILDGQSNTNNINQFQQPHVQQQQQNNNNNQQLQQSQSQSIEELKSRFKTKLGKPIGVVRGNIKKNCESVINELNLNNFRNAKEKLEETLALLTELN